LASKGFLSKCRKEAKLPPVGLPNDGFAKIGKQWGIAARLHRRHLLSCLLQFRHLLCLVGGFFALRLGVLDGRDASHQAHFERQKKIIRFEMWVK